MREFAPWLALGVLVVAILGSWGYFAFLGVLR